LREPEIAIREILNWLSIKEYKGYIDACTSHLYPSPHKSRHKVTWTANQIEKVNMLISSYDFLKGYNFED
jgi:hypothetical protein